MLSQSEKNILKLIKYAPLTIVMFILIVVSYLFFLDKQLEYKKNIENIEKEYISKNKNIIQSEINRVYEYILYEKNNSEMALKNGIKDRVDEAYEIMDFIYNKYKNSLKKEEIIIKIKDALRNYRFNNQRGYFYIYEMNGINVLHSFKPHLEGKNLINIKDKKGLKVVGETIELLKQNDTTFFEFYWNKPNSNKKEYKKISYNRVFKPYNLFIGTGEYIDDFENQIKNKILAFINTIRYSNNGYIFIIDFKGNYLAHIKKEYINLNRINLKDKNGVYITKEIIKIAKNKEGFIKYVGTIKPQTKQPAAKTTFVKGFEDWQWAIATGFYTDELEKQINEMKEFAKQENQKNIIKFIIAALVLTFIFLALSYYISTLLRKKFLDYKDLVDSQIDKNRQKDSMLAQQTKMAAMGEMIQNIAHQWRQPLSLISTASSGIKFKKEFDTLSDEEFYEAVDNINNSTKYLSQTIEDFREFFNPNKKVVFFNLDETITKTLKLIEPQFKSKNINIEKNITAVNLFSYENELIQVIINIFNNSKDEFDKKQLEQKVVLIEVKKEDNSIILKIKDNAGGINEEIIDRIFEPYFTTKHKSQGTGIGLYMAREIIVKHMKGKLEVFNENIVYKKNTYRGAVFKITLDLDALK